MKPLVILAALAAFFVSPAQAQVNQMLGIICVPASPQFAAALRTNGFELKGQATTDGFLMQRWGTPDDSKWKFVLHSPKDSSSCLISSGDNWQTSRSGF